MYLHKRIYFTVCISEINDNGEHLLIYTWVRVRVILSVHQNNKLAYVRTVQEFWRVGSPLFSYFENGMTSGEVFHFPLQFTVCLFDTWPAPTNTERVRLEMVVGT